MNVPQATFTSRIMAAKSPVPPGLSNPDGTPATKRFDVYRNNVAVGLTDALKATFPVILKLVGDEFFMGMAGVYLRRFPPETPMIQQYGHRMPKFLHGFRPAKGLPYLADIAKLELALRDSYHAADHGPISPQALGDLDPDSLMKARIVLAPSVHVLRSKFAVHGIYRANRDADAPAPVKRAENVLVTRPAYDPQVTRISDAAALCLQGFVKGEPLGSAMARGGDSLDLGKLLGLLLQHNAIAEITT